MTGWRPLDGRTSAWFPTSSHAAGAGLVRGIADLLGQEGALPDLDVRRTGVGVTVDDPAAAELVADVARELGFDADPAALQRLSLVVEAEDPTSVTEFWRTVTAYDAADDGLVDPLRRDPMIRVLPTVEHRPLRVRLHLDVSRPHELGREAARQVAPDRAPDGDEWPYFLNAADPEGNEVDLVPVVPDDRFPADAGADDWRLVFGGKVFYTGGRDAVVELVERAAALADAAGLPVMIDVRTEGVAVDSGKDLWEAEGFAGLAGAVQEAARGLGLVAEPHRLRFVQFGLDAVDVRAVREFWRSVLGYEHDEREFLTDIVHPRLLDVPLFFQPMEADDEARRRQRGRMQLRLDVPRDQAAQRVEKALAAGGAVLRSDEGAGVHVLADPEGNELHLHLS